MTGEFAVLPARLPPITRRAFAAAVSRAGGALALGGVAAPAVAAAPALDPDLRDAALRGLALASRRDDPVQAAAAEAALARLAQADPEAALLARLYQRFDVRPALWWEDDLPAADPASLATLHTAVRDSRPVGFAYTDLAGRETVRAVLPLALVHPPQGVKVLAWCRKRADYRQFFVRAIAAPLLLEGTFAPERRALLEGLVAASAAG